MSVKLLTEDHLEYLSSKGGCTGSSESTHVKMPHCWKSHVTAHFLFCVLQVDLRYASIQEEDISMYVVITGFVISNVSTCTVLPVKSDSYVCFVYKVIRTYNRYITCILILSYG